MPPGEADNENQYTRVSEIPPEAVEGGPVTPGRQYYRVSFDDTVTDIGTKKEDIFLESVGEMGQQHEFDTYEEITGNLAKHAFKKFVEPCTSLDRLSNSLLGFFPFLKWLPHYSIRNNLLGDIAAGITIAVLHVPQGIAYALLSGVSPVNGLYMSFFSALIYFFFGTCPHISMGSFAVVALMTGVTNQAIMEKYQNADAAGFAQIAGLNVEQVTPIAITSTLCFTIGICTLIMAVLRLDFLTVYFSDPLVGGFTTGAAVHVFCSQLDDIMGVTLDRVSGAGYLFVVLYRLASKVLESNLYTLGASAVAGFGMIIGKDYVSPFVRRITGKKIVIPWELIAMITATIVSYIFDWKTKYNVPVVGTVPRGLPAPHLPVMGLIPDCLGTAIAITIVNVAVHISMAKMIGKRLGYQIDPGQEIYAVGATATIAGLFPVFPVSTALGRTMVLVESGCKTGLNLLFTALTLLAVILFVGPFFATLPLCILSTVILVALRPMFNKFKTLPKMWSVSRIDCLIWTVSFIATVCIDVIGGLAVSIAFALLTVVSRTQWPSWRARFSKPSLAPNGKTIRRFCVFRFESFLLFTNAERFKQSALDALGTWTSHVPELRPEDKTGFYYIFDCSALTQVDTMGLNALREAVADIQAATNAVVYYANADEAVVAILIKTHIAASHDDFFSCVDDFLDLMKVQPKYQPRSLCLSEIKDE
uniref:STAS domain-containing protein n=1 Tax=Panagrellus redivivus TaxID=6233 RepID=A0A7E4UZL4_PANRE